MRFQITIALVLAWTAFAQDVVSVTEVSANVIVFDTSSGNVVASVGPDGALLIGTPSANSTQQISDILGKRTKSATRYVVIFPKDLPHSEGDAGWGARGAFVAMHEKALEKLGGHSMAATRPLPQHLIDIGVDRPRVAFSEVLTFDINGEAIHIIHQPPAYSDADSIVHFHAANLMYFGDVFPGDGYPEIDSKQGGRFDGFLKMLTSWTGPDRRIVPARGKVVSGTDVKAFCDMLTAVHDRVQHGIDAGKTEQDVLAEHPTADFDARFGNGQVKADAFVHEVYASLKSGAPAAPAK